MVQNCDCRLKSIATESNVSDGYVSKLSRLICDLEPIVGEDYIVAASIDRYDPDGKITFRNKQGEEIFGYFHDGPFMGLTRIPDTGFDERDYILFLAQSYDSFFVGIARDKTVDKSIGPIPQIGIFGVDRGGEVSPSITWAEPASV
jgi:PAS domain-containing protein